MAGSPNKMSGRAAHALVGVLLAVDLIAVMATALVQEAPHEFLGIALFALVVIHVVQTRRWFTALGRGRWGAARVIQLVLIAGLAVCLIGQIASALILSKHALAFLPALPGAAWARSAHMLCSYWFFVLAFAHFGFQLKGMLAKMRFGRDDAGAGSAARVWVIRIVWAAIAVFGVISFVQLGLASYLFAQVQFAAADYAAPLALSFARYAAVGVLVAGIFHFIRRKVR